MRTCLVKGLTVALAIVFYVLRPSLFIVAVDGSNCIVVLSFFDFVLPVSLSEFVKTHINQI